MTYGSWEPRYRVTTVAPGKLDLFVVTLIDGRRAAVGPVTDYEAAVAKAQTFLRQHQCQIKVLPMSGTEVFNLLGITLPDRAEPIDPAVRQQIIATLLQVARESNDPDARGDALKLLATLGELTA